VDLHDVQAAVFEATRSRRPEGWVGSPLQTLQSGSDNRVVFSEYHGHGTRGSGYVIRRGEWKLIWCAEAPHQLFNLAEDPDELVNLTDKAPGVFRALADLLFTICDPMKENARADAFIEQQCTTAMS